jgi:GT2 family glycosyltransferase
MRSAPAHAHISVITPTIGRPKSLVRLLASLVEQTYPVSEVVIADGSADNRTADVVADPGWAARGLKVKRVVVSPPHAVRQREAAIAAASGNLLLLLDDDVELEPDCVAELVKALDADRKAVAVMADFNNQSWSQPTRAWRAYLRLVHGLRDGEWQGRVIGPLLRFGFNPTPPNTIPCEWLGSGSSLIRREAFERVGGFSDFFLHRSTTNEDVDLGLRLAQQGTLLFCPHARLGHFHDPGGRVTPRQAAEDDIYNRFHVLHRSAGRTWLRAMRAVVAYWLIENGSAVVGSLVRSRNVERAAARAFGGLAGLWRILRERDLPSPQPSLGRQA